MQRLCRVVEKPSSIAVEHVLNNNTKWKTAKFLLEALFSGSEQRISQPSIRRTQVISRVLDHLENDLSTTFNIPDLCRVAEVSERTLRNICRDTLSVGPKRYQHYLKLNTVRRELARFNSEQVYIADIANSNGFWHMGQFAADYHKLFNELPSDTQKRQKFNTAKTKRANGPPR